MTNWAPTTPLDTDFISLGDDNIREMKAALEDALQCGAAEGTESVFPGSAPSTAPIFRYRGLKGTTGARPTAGQYGLYFDSTRNALQRDSGTAWEDVGTMIPATTVMVFYQAAAPTGWTKSTANNDKALRVVSGDGGGSGGTHGISTPPSIAHTHTLSDHTHANPAHTHSIAVGSLDIPDLNASSNANAIIVDVGGLRTAAGGGTVTRDHALSTTSSGGATTSGNPSSDTSGSTTPTAFAPQYIDVIVCAKE